MAVIRGRGLGLEVVLSGHDLDDAVARLEAKLAEQPGFYRGTTASVAFTEGDPDTEQVERIRAVLATGGIDLGDVRRVDLGEELAERRAARAPRELRLSPSAKSLVADFAGARADIAARRKRGEGSVPRVDARPPEVKRATPPLAPVEAPPTTLYHTGTVRGGQALHNPGNIVVVGDVNPGAELVAGGDIVVFGRLAGVAHAGAKGDEFARVYALQLVPTQLRIAARIAAGEPPAKSALQPEVAYVADGRIAIAPLEKLDTLPIAPKEA